MQSPTVLGSSCTIGDPNIPNPRCVDPVSKETGYVFEAGNGPTTGRCVENPFNESLGQCEIKGWCDVESENESIT